MAAPKRSERRIKPRCGRGNIYPLPSGSYRAEVMIDGERARAVFPTEEAAQRFLEEVVKRADRYGISLDRTKLKVAQLVALFMDAKKTEGRKRTTLDDYRVMSRYVVKVLGDELVQFLQPAHVTRLLALLKEGKLTVEAERVVWERDAATGKNVKVRRPTRVNVPPLGPKTLRNVYGFVHGVLAFAVQQQIVEANVADRIATPRVDPSEPKPWPQAKLIEFLRAIEGDRLEAMWLLLLDSGLRKGELIALKWEDLDEESGDLRVSRRVVRLSDGTLDYSTPKSRAGLRTVTVSEPVLAKLLVWRAAQKREKMAHRKTWAEGGWMFTTRNGTHLEPRFVNKRLCQILEGARLLEPKKPGVTRSTELTVHGLRHTFCTLLLASNTPIKDVQQVAGHSRASITLDMYGGAIPGASRRVAGKTAAIWASLVASENRSHQDDSPGDGARALTS
jgi:integrase